ncbi:multicopper oxidase family protein [Roseivivax marinus]|uniref:multicopper oxidase family protein n=1 Tax=Roseivivax marinus TaxID=1379903 RepID=UPI001F036E11|nr:multicopper oxidase family protein [Roseivivax marinus]UMA63314.1 multicopper oxidase family protein [Roseivivax marinus]
MNRREFMGSASALVLSMAQGAQAATVEVPQSGPPFRDLPEMRSTDGHLLTELRMAPVTWSLNDETSVEVAAYNGTVPGTLYRLRPGDRLRWTLINDMEPAGLPPFQIGGPPTAAQEALNYTNIHTHGLQVSPGEGHDNVYAVVKPGESLDYAYDIPGPDSGRPQPPGLYWYHPHKHGSTSHQGWQGLAGPIVVEGDIDEVPEVAAARERVMVLNEMLLNEAGQVPSAVIVPTVGPVPFTSVPAMPMDILFPINGVLQPEIDIRPGETQRWRVLAAGPHRFFHLRLDGHALWQISQDGVPFAQAREMDSILLAPGQRAEFIVKGGPPGRYAFRALAYDQGHPGGPRPEKVLGTVVSAGAPMDGPLPGKLVDPPEIPEDARTVVNTRTVTFEGNIASTPVRFYLDGKPFSASRIDQTVLAGTTEEWLLVNEDVFQHPFHIHVNPFQVIEINGEPTGEDSWWDTFALPPLGTAKIRIYFRPDVTGLTVYHCHILPHEDNGMMANLLIYGDLPTGFGPVAGHGGAHGG